MEKKQIDFYFVVENVRDEVCDANKCYKYKENVCYPEDCPIWASLEDVGEEQLKTRMLAFINAWEPRESGHHGSAWHMCQDLRNIIEAPGCNCDECNNTSPTDSSEDVGQSLQKHSDYLDKMLDPSHLVT